MAGLPPKISRILPGSLIFKKNRHISILNCTFNNGISLTVEVSVDIAEITNEYLIFNAGESKFSEKDGKRCKNAINRGKHLYKIEGDNLMMLDSKDTDIKDTFKRLK